MRQQFINGLLAIFNITSLALLPLQYLPSAIGRHMEPDPLDLHSGFPAGAPYWWTDIVPGFLLLTLVLTALFSLLNLLWSRLPRTASDADRRVETAVEVDLCPQTTN
jgi:hypothetical protein